MTPPDLETPTGGEPLLPLRPNGYVGAGRYLLQRHLGDGGMGSVWVAWDREVGKHYALKFLSQATAGNPERWTHLRQELLRAQELRNDHIVGFHDLVVVPGEAPFLKMEYVPGRDLDEKRSQAPEGVMSWPVLSNLMPQLCLALEHAHEHGIIHCDIKPSNLMVDGLGQLKLADFGIAQVADVAQSGPIFGTKAYMSPQRLSGAQPEPRDDLYSVGATLYELLTGEPPFVGDNLTARILEEPAEPLHERLRRRGITNEVPLRIAQLVMRCLDKDPAARPQNARDLGRYLSPTGGAPRTKSKPPPPPLVPSGRPAQPPPPPSSPPPPPPNAVPHGPDPAPSALPATARSAPAPVPAPAFAEGNAAELTPRDQSTAAPPSFPPPSAPSPEELATTLFKIVLLAAALVAAAIFAVRWPRVTPLSSPPETRPPQSQPPPPGASTAVESSAPGALELTASDTARANAVPPTQFAYRIDRDGVDIAQGIAVHADATTVELDPGEYRLRLGIVPESAPDHLPGHEVTNRFRIDARTKRSLRINFGAELVDASANVPGSTPTNAPTPRPEAPPPPPPPLRSSPPVKGEAWVRSSPRRGGPDQARFAWLGVPGASVWIGARETALRDFRAFADESAVGRGIHVPGPTGWTLDDSRSWQDPGFSRGEDHPVVGVNWTEAQAYCRWLTNRDREDGLLRTTQGYRLPTLAEFRHAARDLRPGPGIGNVAGLEVRQAPGWHPAWPTFPGHEDPYPFTSPAGSFPSTADGVADLIGNVSEWCQDWFGPDPHEATLSVPSRRIARPIPPNTLKAAAGGSWFHEGPEDTDPRIALGFPPEHRFCFVGFRVVLEDLSDPP